MAKKRFKAIVEELYTGSFSLPLALAAILMGVLLMAYPLIANYVFEHRKDSIVNTYEQASGQVGKSTKEEILRLANEYNESLFTQHIQLCDPFSEDAAGMDVENYKKQLCVDGSDMMGFIEIPAINVSLPVYHGTSQDVLEKGVGHLEGTSLPVGGPSTHCVLTGHTGLSNTKMFTDLVKLEEGDIFVLRVMNDKIAYQVDQIKVVLPSELDDLVIEQGKDFCTLITCTPYGVNTHRLLVRGKRTEYEEMVRNQEFFRTKAEDSQWMYQYKKSLAIAFSVIILTLGSAAIKSRRKRGRDLEKKD